MAVSKLTNGQIHTLAVGLRSLDTQLEKIAPDVRFKIGVLLNKVQPLAELLERTQQRAFAEVAAASAKTVGDKKETPAEQQLRDVQAQADVADKIEELRNKVPEGLELRTILKSELRLDENPKVTGLALSQVMPVLEGIE